jgi:hypothetical protein
MNDTQMMHRFFSNYNGPSLRSCVIEQSKTEPPEVARITRIEEPVLELAPAASLDLDLFLTKDQIQSVWSNKEIVQGEDLPIFTLALQTGGVSFIRHPRGHGSQASNSHVRVDVFLPGYLGVEHHTRDVMTWGTILMAWNTSIRENKVKRIPKWVATRLLQCYVMGEILKDDKKPWH